MSKYKEIRVDGRKVYFHRILMAEKLGRPLLACEHVYHLDGDPRNNDIQNLVIIKKTERT